MSSVPFYLKGTKNNVITSTHLTNFSKSNPELDYLIQKYPIILKPLDISDFQSICYWVISQQISGKVAEIFIQRLKNKIHEITPDAIHGISHKEFRDIGLSNSKIETLQRLINFFHDTPINYDRSAPDNDIRDHYTKIKGIGPWTVNMHLIFTLGRLNVKATGDLVVRKGIMKMYQGKINQLKDQLQTNKAVVDRNGVINETLANKITRKWEPLATLGTLLAWEIMENV